MLTAKAGGGVFSGAKIIAPLVQAAAIQVWM